MCVTIISAAITSIIGLYPTIENGEVVMKTPNSILITTDKSGYKIGEPVLIKMKNIGGNSLETNSMPVGFTVYDDHDNQMKTWIGALGVMGKFHPGDEVTHVWDQKEDHSREQVKPGTYKVRPGNVIGSIGDPVQEFRILPVLK